MVEEVLITTRRSGLEEYRKIVSRRILFLTLCASLLILLFGLSLSLGSAQIPLTEVYMAVLKRFIGGIEVSSLADTVIWHLRLPRTIMAALCGATLAMSGRVTMVVLRNPLATPYTLGVSAGAGLGATVAIILGRGIPTGAPLIVSNAFLVSLVPIMVILLASRRAWVTPETMILMGVAMSYIFNATNTLIQFIAEAEAVRAAVFWLIGDLSRASWWQVPYATAVLLIAFTAYIRFALDLNAIKSGEEVAKGLGVEVENVRRVLLVVSCLSTSTLVSFTGAIGFICLLAPHITRIVVGEDEHYVIPISGLVGADLLLAADIIARRAAAPVMLPVGAVTALLGGPLLFYLLYRRT